MSACTSYRELLLDVLYGEVSEPDHAAFEAHCAGCDSCRDDFERLRAVSQGLAAWEPVEAPILARTWPLRRRSFRELLRSPRLAWSAAAAALLLGLLLRADLRVQNGVVRVSLAMPGATATPSSLEPEQVAAVIQAAINQSEDRQRRELALVLAGMVEQIESDVAQQLYTVHSDLDRLENTTYRVVNASQWSLKP
jgi:anti-sigma factor RsiW